MIRHNAPMPRIVSNQVEVFPFRRRPAGVEFLLLRRAAADYLGGTWHAVHGAIEPGETAVQAALRELHEESGLRPLRFWQIDYVSVFFLARADAVCMNPVFTAELPADAQVRLSSEHDAFEWIVPSLAAARLMWPNQRHALREIIEEVLGGGPGEPALRIDLAGLPGADG